MELRGEEGLVWAGFGPPASADGLCHADAVHTPHSVCILSSPEVSAHTHTHTHTHTEEEALSPHTHQHKGYCIIHTHAHTSTHRTETCPHTHQRPHRDTHKHTHALTHRLQAFLCSFVWGAICILGCQKIKLLLHLKLNCISKAIMTV